MSAKENARKEGHQRPIQTNPTQTSIQNLIGVQQTA